MPIVNLTLMEVLLHLLVSQRSASVRAQLFSAADVPMEVLGGLVIPQVRVDAGSPEAGHEVPGDHLRRPHQFQEQVVVPLFQRQQRFYVLFRQKDDVVFPQRVGVVEGKHPLVVDSVVAFRPFSRLDLSCYTTCLRKV